MSGKLRVSRSLIKKNNFFQIDKSRQEHNRWFVYRIKNTSILKEIQMSKSCAFFGNDYKWRRDDIIEKVKEQALLLIAEEGVDTFYVGSKGAYERDAYNAVLQIKTKQSRHPDSLCCFRYERG